MQAKKKKVLVVVAHPDDETIWMGGTLFDNKDRWETTIISLCRRDDTDRAPKFKKVCKIYKAKCFISDLEDEDLKDLEVDEAIQRIKQFVDGKYYDFIFTHGKNGEYGHTRHKDVHKAVNLLLENKELKANKVFFFDYVRRGNFCYANSRAIKFINLKNSTLMKKKFIIQNVYGFQKGGFEEICCRQTEGYKIKDLK